MGEKLPKAFVELGGCTMLARAVDGLRKSGAIDRVVVIVPPELVESVVADLGRAADVDVVGGGAERTDSVRAGLSAAGDADFVLVHDAARALTPPALIARVVGTLRAGSSAVIPVLPVTDTIKSVDVLGAVTGTPLRSELRAVQTPKDSPPTSCAVRTTPVTSPRPTTPLWSSVSVFRCRRFPATLSPSRSPLRSTWSLHGRS